MALHLQLLSMACFLGWTLCYALILRQARADGRVGMPLVPLCVNVTYEFVFGFVYPDVPPVNYSNQMWFVVDLFLFAQYLRYGRAELSDLVPRRWFLPIVFGTLALAVWAVLAITWELHDEHGGNYTGWGEQLLISVSMLALLNRRRSSAGQSMWIGLSRMVGTLCLIPVQLDQMPHSKLMIFLYVAFPLVDAAYLVLLYRQCRREGRDPWSLAVTRREVTPAAVAQAA